MVRVYFPSLIYQVTNQKETEVLAGTLGEVIDRLVERYGEPFERMIFDMSGEINRYFRFYIKGRLVQEHNKLDTKLNEDDEVVVLIIISGG